MLEGALSLISADARRSIGSQIRIEHVQGDSPFVTLKGVAAMCYEYSGWFDKIRARELRKARENIDALNRRPEAAPASAVKPTEAVTPKTTPTPEKVPA